MRQILITCREALIAAIPLIPIYLFLNHYRFRNFPRSLIYMVFSVYLAAMYAAVGLPDITYYRYHPRFNFTPFLYMFSDWETTCLNVLLFFPLGFMLPVLWKDFSSPIKTILFGFIITLCIELLQIFTYRATDINDLITNTFGTIVGYLAAKLFLLVFCSVVPAQRADDIKLVFGTSLFVMFFIYPFIV